MLRCGSVSHIWLNSEGAADQVAAHLRDTHKGWHNAVHVSTAISERLLLAALPVDCLQRLIQCLELECGLLLGQLQTTVCQEATVLPFSTTISIRRRAAAAETLWDCQSTDNTQSCSLIAQMRLLSLLLSLCTAFRMPRSAAQQCMSASG